MNNRDSASPVVELLVTAPVARITLNRPAARNAVDHQLAYELDQALTSVEEDDDILVVVLAAAGPVFCAGQDLKALARGEGESVIEDRGWAGLTERVRNKPLIAAVDGAAIGGGCELVLACDLVVASARATFAVPEARWGLLAARGGAARLPHLVGPMIANEMLLTGEPITAGRAFALGFVNRLAEAGQVLARAEELALEISRNAPLAVVATRRVVTTSLALGEAAGGELSLRLLADLLSTDDATEGLRAFAERRPPIWRGR